MFRENAAEFSLDLLPKFNSTDCRGLIVRPDELHHSGGNHIMRNKPDSGRFVRTGFKPGYGQNKSAEAGAEAGHLL